MFSKNQSAPSPGSPLINFGANSCKLIINSTLVAWHNPLIFSSILVLFHPTSGCSEIHFYFEIHSEMAEIHVSGFNRYD